MKIALITGASGGIGSETVKVFAENGFFVLGIYNRGAKEIEDLREFLKEKGLSEYFFAYKCDLKSETEIDAVINSINKSFAHIDVLVNNAGADLFKLITETSAQEWDDIFAVNVKSAFLFTKFALKSMIDRKRGKIVNVSSVWGASGASVEAAYSASKAALIGFTKATAKEVAESGINVNCVSPGVVDTKMNDCFTEEEKRELVERTPLSRMGSPKEIAELIYFLSSDKAAFITGQNIVCDGGFIL